MKSFLTFNFLASLIASLLVSCGGSSLSGGGDTKKEKKTTHGDQNASDPQVVTGAYLACESSPSDKTSAQDAIGCNVMSNNQKVPASSSLSMKFYSEYQSKQSQPTQANSKSGYQALFLNSTAQTQSTRFVGQVYSGGTMLKEISCDGSKLPCVAPIIAAAANLNELKVDGQFNLSPEGFTTLKKDTCVLNPANYCHKNGAIWTDKVSKNMSPNEKDQCLSALEQMPFTKTVFDNILTLPGQGFDPTKSNYCAVKKQGAFLAKDPTSGCYATLIREGNTS